MNHSVLSLGIGFGLLASACSAGSPTFSNNPAAQPDAGPAKPSYDDINTSLIVMVGIISAIVTYLSVVVVQALTYQMDMNMIRQRSYGMQYLKSAEALGVQKAKLLADPAVHRVSIEQAMADTVSQFAPKNQ